MYLHLSCDPVAIKVSIPPVDIHSMYSLLHTSVIKSVPKQKDIMAGLLRQCSHLAHSLEYWSRISMIVIWNTRKPSSAPYSESERSDNTQKNFETNSALRLNSRVVIGCPAHARTHTWHDGPRTGSELSMRRGYIQPAQYSVG